MEEQDKMSGGEFVNIMAQLGEKHARMIANTLQIAANELALQNTEKKLKNIHPIFISAGHGAYYGALNIMLKKNDPLVAALNRDLSRK